MCKTHIAMSASTRADKLEPFVAWMGAQGITWNDAAVKLTHSDVAGNNMVVRAAKDIYAGCSLCVLPKSALLSVENSGLAGVLAAERVGGGLALTLAVLRELLLGPDSPWYDQQPPVQLTILPEHSSVHIQGT